MVMIAAKSNGRCLLLCDERFLHDKDIVIEAVKSFPSILYFVSDELKFDYEVVLEAVSKNGACLMFADESLKNDPDLRNLALKDNVMMIEFFGKVEQEDKAYNELILNTVRSNGLALEFASAELRNDPTVVAEALWSNPASIRFVGEELKSKSQFFQLLEKNGGNVDRSVEQEYILLKGPVVDGVDKEWESVVSRVYDRNHRRSSGKFKKPGNLEVIDSNIRLHWLLKQEIARTPMSELKYIRILGHGAFGRVYMCCFPKSKILGFFAFKIYPYESTGSLRDCNKWVSRESIEIPPHPNVNSPLFASVHSESKPLDIKSAKFPDYEQYWKTNFVPILNGGALLFRLYPKDLTQFYEERSPSLVEVCYILDGLLRGTRYVHKHFIVHRDLYPSNILLDEHSGRVVIADFGCALDLRSRMSFVISSEDELLMGMMYSVSYFNKLDIGGFKKCLPPEIVDADQFETKFYDYEKCDIFSVGYVGREIMKRVHDSSRVEFVRLKSLIVNLLESLALDIDKRPTFGPVLEELSRITPLFELDDKVMDIDSRTTRKRRIFVPRREATRSPVSPEDPKSWTPVLEMIQKDDKVFQQNEYEVLLNDERFILLALERNGYVLGHLSAEDRNNDAFVLCAVKEEGKALQFASDRLRNDKKVVIEAVKQNGGAILVASVDLQKDPDVILEAVKQNGLLLEFVDPKLRSDFHFVLSSVKQNGQALEFASEELRKNPKIIREAIMSDRLAFKFIHEDFIESSPLLSILKENDGIVEIALDKFCRLKEIDSFTEGVDEYERKWKDPWKDLVFEKLKKAGRIQLEFGTFKKYYVRQEDVKKLEIETSKLKDSLDGFGFSDYKLYRYLGRGEFGYTHLCRPKKGFGVFVIKVYRDQYLGLAGQNKEMIDRDKLYIPYHPNVVTIISHQDEEDIDRKILNYKLEEKTGKKKSGFVIMKYHPKTLDKFIISRRRDGGRFSIVEICRMMKGIISGVCHLHDHKIVHMDLHPQNIFLDEERGTILVGDFGNHLNLNDRDDYVMDLRKDEDEAKLSSFVDTFKGFQKDSYKKLTKNQEYLPPEVTNAHACSKIKIDFEMCDIYSSGVCGKELLYAGRTKEEISNSDECCILYTYLQKLIDPNPKKRMKYDKALKEIEQIAHFVELQTDSKKMDVQRNEESQKIEEEEEEEEDGEDN